MTVVQRPEECLHFLQIGMLAFLVWRALPQTRGALGWGYSQVPWWAPWRRRFRSWYPVEFAIGGT
jgi:hypothetical protein